MEANKQQVTTRIKELANVLKGLRVFNIIELYNIRAEVVHISDITKMDNFDDYFSDWEIYFVVSQLSPKFNADDKYFCVDGDGVIHSLNYNIEDVLGLVSAEDLAQFMTKHISEVCEAYNERYKNNGGANMKLSKLFHQLYRRFITWAKETEPSCATWIEEVAFEYDVFSNEWEPLLKGLKTAHDNRAPLIEYLNEVCQ